MPVLRQLSNDLAIADYDYFLFLIDDVLSQMRKHLEWQQKTYEAYVKELKNHGDTNKNNKEKQKRT